MCVVNLLKSKCTIKCTINNINLTNVMIFVKYTSRLQCLHKSVCLNNDFHKRYLYWKKTGSNNQVWMIVIKVLVK